MYTTLYFSLFLVSMCAYGKKKNLKMLECGLSIKYGACNQTLFYFLSNKVDIREMWCIDDLFSAGLGLFCFLISISCKSFWERFFFLLSVYRKINYNYEKCYLRYKNDLNFVLYRCFVYVTHKYWRAFTVAQ